MSCAEDKILRAEVPYEPIFQGKPGESILSRIFERIDCVIQDGQSDRKWLTDIADFNQPKFRRFGEIKPLSYQVASAFKALGIGAGDVVQLYLPNSIDYYIVIFGAWLCGAIVSMCDSTMKAKSIESQVKDSQPKLVFCTGDNLDEVMKGSSKQSFIVLASKPGAKDHMSYESFLAKGNSESIEVPKSNPDDCTLIFWSSGTTGRPKGIKHSQKSVVNLMQASLFAPGNMFVTTMFTHIGGFTMPLCGSIFGTYDIVFHGNDFVVECQHIFEAINKYKPHFLVLGAHHAVHMVSAPTPKDVDLSSVEMIYPIGSSTYTGVLEDLRQILPNLSVILNFYGMTEIGTLTTGISQNNLGKLLGGREAKFINPETNKVLGPNQVGEIWGKTPIMTLGYLNQPDLDKHSIGPGGFFRTGDLGYFDEEGTLFFQERLKDLIKYKNNHVYPADIELIIQRHPDIVEVAVFGLPELTVQELVSALVVKMPGSKLTEDDVKALVAKEDLESYKLIRGPVKFVPSLPRNTQARNIDPPEALNMVQSKYGPV
eukprot:maker-scaffold53_size449031-snap-gene-0.11 protein:Tk04163 transcript:maker-scaffold53_size449031-snap-gene-0.11-mRNA-1 annotation:"luciferin 4-monooxygenase-like"